MNLWHVFFSVPRANSSGKHSSWAWVAADSAEQAMAIVRVSHPECFFYQVVHQGTLDFCAPTEGATK